MTKEDRNPIACTAGAWVKFGQIECHMTPGTGGDWFVELSVAGQPAIAKEVHLGLELFPPLGFFFFSSPETHTDLRGNGSTQS